MGREGIIVEKLSSEIHDGDWHDKPMRWTVKGPGQEVQNFSTKASANQYRTIRRTSSSFAEASTRYLREAR